MKKVYDDQLKCGCGHMPAKGAMDSTGWALSILQKFLSVDLAGAKKFIGPIFDNALSNLGPDYFSPDLQHKMTNIKNQLANSKPDIDDSCKLQEKLAKCLKEIVLAFDSQHKSFEAHLLEILDLINDDELKTMIEEDYRELSNVLLPNKAWKSALFLTGSIVEAILIDVLNNLDVDGVDIERGTNTLDQLLTATTSTGRLSSAQATQVREAFEYYRRGSMHHCNAAAAKQAKDTLDYLCNILKKEFNPVQHNAPLPLT